MFLYDSWYVFGWNYELADAGGTLGRVMLGQPVVVWRDTEGSLHAMQDRCPHRHAPLSMGRVEGNTLRCMYHGMQFDRSGKCIHVPGMENAPDARVRVFPVAEKDGWIWVWMGDVTKADEAFIPTAFGIDDPDQPMRTGRMEYDAHYQLIHDNLCDLSHLDFVHETTLGAATGVRWSDSAPRVLNLGQAIRFERWFRNGTVPSDPEKRIDIWSSYDFAVPGIFIMSAKRFPAGTADACDGKAPVGLEPINQTIEQQAVTPITERHTAYHYATGMTGDTQGVTVDIEARRKVVQDAFEEDRQIILAQQRIWDLTPEGEDMLFLPQDKGPFLMRRMIDKLLQKQGPVAV